MSRHGKYGLITTTEELRARCETDPATHCWLWSGAYNKRSGMPIIWAFDYDRVEKRAMTGTRAAWSLAFGESPRNGALVYRSCCRATCVNPAHLRLADTRAEIGRHIRLSGTRKGTPRESWCKSLPSAWAASGVQITPPDLVRKVREAGPEVTGRSLASEYGLTESVVSRIRRGESHKWVSV